MPNKLVNMEIRSEEVQEILTRVPTWMIRWGSTLFFFLIILILILSWIIKYPDVIQTKAFLTTKRPAEKIYARTTARIDSIFIKPNQKIVSGNPIALLENTAKFDDVQKLKILIDTIDIRSPFINLPISEMPSLFLGEIDPAYAAFENDYIKYSIHKKYQPFKNESNAQLLKLSELRLQYGNIESQIEINKKELKYRRDDMERSKKLYGKGVIAQREFENQQIQFLQSQRNYESLLTFQSQLRNELIAARSNTKATDISSIRETMSLNKSMIQSFIQLKKSIKDWENKYLLHSVDSGIVSYMNYWSKNQTVNQGEIIFTVIPIQNNKYIAKLITPARNSGKIQLGQIVNINLYNYPENEFGVLKGLVSNISATPREDQSYIVDVSLPDSLITTYGKSIDYKPEMPGSAEIITEDLRLLERLFIQFKQVFDR